MNKLLKMNTKFSNNILVEINHKVDKKFYSINRRMRDNIHYSEISIFSKDEIDFLDKNQNIYLDIIYKHFVDNMNLDINDDDISMLRKYSNNEMSLGDAITSIIKAELN